MLAIDDTAPANRLEAAFVTLDRDAPRDDTEHAIATQGRLIQPIKQVDRFEVRVAIVALALSVLVFFAVAPFAKTMLGPLPAFVPMYVSALIICNVITAALLLSQFVFLRSPALLVLAGGYVFTAAMTVGYALIFPGVFAPDGLLGAGPQTTSAMYMFWHGGFPLVIIAYTLVKRILPATAPPASVPRRSAAAPIVATIAVVLAIATAFTAFATAGNGYLPAFLVDNHSTDLSHLVLGGIWLLSLAALVRLWRQKPRTVLDFWLMLVMCVWLFDIALSAVLNAGRYDLGWYVGRAYGLLASSALLIVLLVENGHVYARLVRVTAKLNDATKSFEQLSLHDPLTGLANRRYLDAHLTTQLAVAMRHRRSLALILCDIDLFKSFNDRYGHQAGDECLVKVAAALRSCCRRPADLAARYGGEEFALILPDTDLAGARRIAELLMAAVAELGVNHEGSGLAPHVSISGGVAVLSPGDAMTDVQLIAAADENLFRAKRLGRNRVEFGPALESTIVPFPSSAGLMAG